MSFREKSAWVTLISVLLVTLIYLLHVPWNLEQHTGRFAMHAFFAGMIMFMVIEVIAHIVLYIKFPKDARTPKDERELLIDLKAIRIAAYVYVIATFAAVATLHFGANNVAIAYGVMLGFIIAEIVNYGMRIYYYRRGF